MIVGIELIQKVITRYRPKFGRSSQITSVR